MEWFVLGLIGGIVLLVVINFFLGPDVYYYDED